MIDIVVVFGERDLGYAFRVRVRVMTSVSVVGIARVTVRYGLGLRSGAV